jgi:octaprenyl-diphosphate synthase
MQAFRVALSFRNFGVLDVLIELTQRMVAGELAQLDTLGTIISWQQYFELVACKTAALFSGCARLGAMVGDGSLAAQEALASYGQHLGTAFQIVDDVLDLTASERVLGKPTASDLREGKATLPVLHAYVSASCDERHRLEQVLRERGFDGVDRSDVLAIIERYGSIEASLQVAQTYAELACRALAGFADSDAKRALMSAPEFVVNRKL